MSAEATKGNTLWITGPDFRIACDIGKWFIPIEAKSAVRPQKQEMMQKVSLKK